MGNKKVTINIQGRESRIQFLSLMRKILKDELHNNTLKVLVKEADSIEFAFKDNGFARLGKRDIEDMRDCKV